MRNTIKKVLDSFKSSSTKEKTMMVGIVSVLVTLACVAVKLSAPLLITVGFIYFLIPKGNTNEIQQQAVYMEENRMRFIILYENVARIIFPILKEFNTALGIAPATVNSIYSEEKFIYYPNISVPILVYVAEKKFPPTVNIFDVKSAIQRRFNQESLPLYLIKIDNGDPYYYKFYILPINSKKDYDWARADWQRRFNNTRPQKPGDRKDKDF